MGIPARAGGKRSRPVLHVDDLLIRLRSVPTLGRSFGLLTCAALAVFIPLSPMLYAIGWRVVEGRYVSAPVLWRSSASGVDLLAFFIPNPMPPWFGALWRDWLTTRPEGFVENVASIPFGALGVIGAAAAVTGRISRRWLVFTLGFAWLALGPFVHIAGLNTSVPTPWTLLRYVPIVGSARMPTRFVIVVMLGISVLFGLALADLRQRYPRRRRTLMLAGAVILACELMPVPRRLYAASIPSFCYQIAKDSRDVKVLDLPLGIRDGLSSVGNITARSQFHQTVHHKPVVGGYLSRVSPRRTRAHRKLPVLDALLTLSEGRPLEDWQRRRAWACRDEFAETARLGYVTIDRQLASQELIDYAIKLLNLRLIVREERYSLYAPMAIDAVEKYR